MTAFQSSSLTMRSSGTSSITKRLGSFRRDRCRPLAGSFLNPCRFHTRRPMYASLFRMPMPRVKWPRIVDLDEIPPVALNLGPADPDLVID